MRSRRALAAVMALALHASSARAQAVEDPAALFSEAVTMLRGARYLEALALLERVRSARETPAVLYNLAIAERGLGRPLDAIASLERYLTLAGERIDDARREEVATHVREMRATVGSMTVTVRADGADVAVTLDGDPLARARWGEARAINPGRHVLRLTGQGLRPLEVVREVAPGASVAVDLRPEPVDVETRLAVLASVRNAEVVLDGMLMGTDGYSARINPGRHEVVVRARGHLPYSTTLDIEPGAAVRVRADLRRDVPITERWWFWTAVSVAAAGAIAGVAIAAASGTADPDCGSTGRCF